MIKYDSFENCSMKMDSQDQQHTESIETSGSSTYLILTPLNETFEGKCLLLPIWPQTLRMGRQTSARTAPTPNNGYFDSKVLSRVHAEVWADTACNAIIRDTQSSNGTFLNGQRLSAENQMSEPIILHTGDILEFGIDILNEENQSILHHRVAARVEHAGPSEAYSFDFPDLLETQVNTQTSEEISWTETCQTVTPRILNSITYERGTEISSEKSSILAASTISTTSLREKQNMIMIDNMLQRLSEGIKTAKMQANDLSDVTIMLNSIQKTFLQDRDNEPLTSMNEDKFSSIVNLEVLAMKQLEIEEKMTKIQQHEIEQRYEETYKQMCKQMIDVLLKERKGDVEEMENRVEMEYAMKENEKGALNQQVEIEKEDSNKELKALQHMLEATRKELEIWRYRAKMTENIVEQSTHHVAALLKTSETQMPLIDETDDDDDDNSSFNINLWLALV
ncbi:hypothetical protein PCANB_002143 [Pneumocystis canis]|nr:hypothetical protein PCANB_002143 [Pneumocystis canis]